MGISLSAAAITTRTLADHPRFGILRDPRGLSRPIAPGPCAISCLPARNGRQ